MIKHLKMSDSILYSVTERFEKDTWLQLTYFTIITVTERPQVQACKLFHSSIALYSVELSFIKH